MDGPWEEVLVLGSSGGKLCEEDTLGGQYWCCEEPRAAHHQDKGQTSSYFLSASSAMSLAWASCASRMATRSSSMLFLFSRAFLILIQGVKMLGKVGCVGWVPGAEIEQRAELFGI